MPDILQQTDILLDLLSINSYDNFIIVNYEYLPKHHAWDTNGFDLYIYIKGKYERVGV
jgi:hypothetical protein